MSTREACDRGVASLLVQQILASVGATRTDRVILVGCEQIELLIELAHRGFADVLCRSARGGPSIGDKSADIVVAPNLDREGECTAALLRMERALRPNGVLLLGIGSPPLKTQQIRKFLSQRGFALLHTDLVVGDLQLLSCRKVPVLEVRAA